MSYGRQSNGPDGLSFPIGVNVSGDGKVVVCDTRGNVVKLFNKDGTVHKLINNPVWWPLFWRTAETLLQLMTLQS